MSVHVSDTPHLDFVRKNFRFKNMPFGELLDELTAEAETEGTDEEKKTALSTEVTVTIGAAPTEVTMRRNGDFLIQCRIFQGKCLAEGKFSTIIHQGTHCLHCPWV